MWGIRAIRGGVLAGCLLGLIASSGCCECAQSLWKGGKPPTSAQPTGQTNAVNGDAKDPEEVLKTWNRGSQFQDGSHLTPERVQGGIY